MMGASVLSSLILSMSFLPLVSGKKNVSAIINILLPTLIHMNTSAGTVTITADMIVASLPKVLARPKAKPRIWVG